MAKGPVCGKQVDETLARFKSEHEGKTFCFYCEGCLRSFEADPARYLAGNSMSHDQGSHGY